MLSFPVEISILRTHEAKTKEVLCKSKISAKATGPIFLKFAWNLYFRLG